MAAIIDECEHIDEMTQQHADYVAAGGVLYGEFCGESSPHGVHDGCLGIMCDYGCNAENF